MASLERIWVPVAQKLLRHAITAGSRVGQLVRAHASGASHAKLEAIPVRSTPSHPFYSGSRSQPVHPQAFRRQLKNGSSKWFSTSSSPSAIPSGFRATLRRFFSTGNNSQAIRYVDRVAYLQSRVGSQAVWRASGRAPFASTLRPNLTGGALPRTAGGYTTGGAGRSGSRYFSHTPQAPAQVVQNVSQAMRAFWLSGQRARFDGTDAHGRPSYKAISALEEQTARRVAVPAMPKMTPGAFVDFALSPTITALAPLAAAAGGVSAGVISACQASASYGASLGTEGFLDVLSVDFARALQELTLIMNDIKRLAEIGDLPVLLHQDAGGAGCGRAGSVLRVRFPGVDAQTVDRLCEDLGVTHGIVGQDAGFDEAVGSATALRFPFAPDAETGDVAAATPPALTSPGGSLRSRESSDLGDSISDDEFDRIFGAGPDGEDGFLITTPDDHVDYHGNGYSNENNDNSLWLASSSGGGGDGYGYESTTPPVPLSSGDYASSEFEGVEGVYRFLEACG